MAKTTKTKEKRVGQVEGFKKVARDLEADLSEDRFNNTLARLTNPNKTAKTKDRGGSK